MNGSGVTVLAATDFHQVLQGAMVNVGLPAAGIALIVALIAGKKAVVGGIVLSVLLALGFTFGDASTWKGVGNGVADGISAMKNWHA